MRTTFITGFPGETDAHVDELDQFIHDSAFSHVGVFTYSFEPDTPAAKLSGHLDEAVKEARRERLMKTQQNIVFDRIASQIGSTQTAILDKPIEGEKNVWLGRTTFDAPDVDGLVFVTDPTGTGKQGSIIDCEIVTSQGYDLVGVATGTAR